MQEALGRLRALPRAPLVAVGGQAFATAAAATSLDGAVFVRTPEELVSQLGARFPQSSN